MQNAFDFMDVEMLFEEVDIQGIPYLLPIRDLPVRPEGEVHVCRGTLRMAFALEKILQNRHDPATDL